MAIKKPKCNICAASLVKQSRGLWRCPVGFIDFKIDESAMVKKRKITLSGEMITEEEYVVPPAASH